MPVAFVVIRRPFDACRRCPGGGGLVVSPVALGLWTGGRCAPRESGLVGRRRPGRVPVKV